MMSPKLLNGKRVIALTLAVFVLMLCPSTELHAQAPTFIRGDVDSSGTVDIDDVCALECYIYGWSDCTQPGGGPCVGYSLYCMLAADVNDDGIANSSDMIYLIKYVRQAEFGGPPPPAPFPECGEDPTNPQSGDDCCGGSPPAPTEPTTPAPSPTSDPVDVISLFCDSYVCNPVTTWSADWDDADVEDVDLSGNMCKKYTNLVFAGVDFAAYQIDITEMIYFSFDLWTPDATTFPVELRVKLVDFGPDGTYDGGAIDDVESELSLTAEIDCCLGIRGNTNGDQEDKVTISDVTYLIKYLFGQPNGPVPACNEEGNTNGDSEEKITISDVTYLIKYLFGQPNGPQPPPCPLPLEVLTTGQWVHISIPMSEFTGLTTREHLSQLVLSGDLSTVYLDNIMFQK